MKRFAFEPGHRNNIFQARVLPNTSDKTIVSCAADGQVRAFWQVPACGSVLAVPNLLLFAAQVRVSHLGEGGAVTKRKLSQHDGRAHKLALLHDQPHTFFRWGSLLLHPSNQQIWL